MIKASRVAALAFLSLAMIVACKKKPETAVVPVGPTNTPGETCDAACRARLADSLARKRVADSLEVLRLANEARARELGATKATLMQVILFDYDQAEIMSDMRPILDGKLPILRANAALRIRINGHADERGSDEYNLALGQRRAAAAKRYLTDQGIDPGRIDIMSFGEERPVATDGTEGAFRLNRRAEFEITAGENTMVPVVPAR